MFLFYLVIWPIVYRYQYQPDPYTYFVLKMFCYCVFWSCHIWIDNVLIGKIPLLPTTPLKCTRCDIDHTPEFFYMSTSEPSVLHHGINAVCHQGQPQPPDAHQYPVCGDILIHPVDATHSLIIDVDDIRARDASCCFKPPVCFCRWKDACLIRGNFHSRVVVPRENQ